MKRSEMITKLVDLISYQQKNNMESRFHAKFVLDCIEKMGMRPPFRDKLIKRVYLNSVGNLREDHIIEVNEWELEDEQLPKL